MAADILASIDGARPDPGIKGAMRWNPALAAARSVTQANREADPASGAKGIGKEERE